MNEVFGGPDFLASSVPKGNSLFSRCSHGQCMLGFINKQGVKNRRQHFLGSIIEIIKLAQRIILPQIFKGITVVDGFALAALSIFSIMGFH